MFDWKHISEQQWWAKWGSVAYVDFIASANLEEEGNGGLTQGTGPFLQVSADQTDREKQSLGAGTGILIAVNAACFRGVRRALLISLNTKAGCSYFLASFGVETIAEEQY